MKLTDYGHWCHLTVTEIPVNESHMSRDYRLLYEEYVRTKDANQIQNRMNELLDSWPPRPKYGLTTIVELKYWSHNQPYHAFKLRLNHTTRELDWAGELNGKLI